jgi:ferredoxin
MRIVVHRGLCDGNGECVKAAPALLAQGEDELVVLRRESFGEADRAAAEAAVRLCPKGALRLAD